MYDGELAFDQSQDLSVNQNKETEGRNIGIAVVSGCPPAEMWMEEIGRTATINSTLEPMDPEERGW